MKHRIRVISIIAAFSILLSIGAEAAYVGNPGDQGDELPSFEEIQALFPEVELTEDGHVADYPALQSDAEVTDEEWIEIHNNPVEKYTAQDGDDMHYLWVYSDGTYSVAGVILSEEVITARDADAKASNGQVKAYWKEWYTDIEYSMYYYLNYGKTSAGYTTLSYTGFKYCYAYAVDLTPLGYSAGATAGRINITRATGNASNKASAYSIASCQLEGITTHRRKLTLYGGKDNDFSVSTSILAPT